MADNLQKIYGLNFKVETSEKCSLLCLCPSKVGWLPVTRNPFHLGNKRIAYKFMIEGKKDENNPTNHFVFVPFIPISKLSDPFHSVDGGSRPF